MAFEQVLVVIDLQRDYVAGGNFPLPDIERAISQSAKLIGLFRRNRLPVVHVRHLEKDPAVGFLMEGTPGSEIDERVGPSGQDLLITKHWPNAFRDTTLSKILHVLGSHKLVFCGAMTNMCIDATVRAAFDAGYVCTVVSDACAASDLEFEGTLIPAATVHGSFLAALASAYGEVTTVEALAAKLQPAN